MKYFSLLVFLISQVAFAQLTNSVELNEKLTVESEEAVRKELLHLASLKSIEKFAPEMGYKASEFTEKLNSRFATAFNAAKEQKLVEKFGADYKNTLSDKDKEAFLAPIEADRHNAFIKFARTLDILRSHTFGPLVKTEEGSWKTKVDLDMDKIKLEKQLRKIINGETKPFSKIVLVSEIDPFHFTWADLGLESETAFLNPLNASWSKWLNDNLPTTVEEAVVCDVNCSAFYSKWSETHVEEIRLPEEYAHAVLLKINVQLKRSHFVESLKEVTFEWEGRALLQDFHTKRILGSFALPLEKRTFRQLDQKALNSGLASSIYRSPMTAFMQFNRKLEEKIGFNRVSKLVIQGQKNVGDVLALIELLKTRGSSLGLEVFLDSFSKGEAKLNCFYRGEEKSFTDLLSAIKELKSSHSYTLVSDLTGPHFVIKLVTE